jgi:tRNA (cytidine/uridine-2'-O-)-methyltransferase
MRIALFQPDIPPNVGTIIRLGACLGVPIDVIEPCGFPFSDKSLRRAGMDYLDRAAVTRHGSWNRFLAGRDGAPAGRLVLLTTKGAVPYTSFAFAAGDTLLFGRESAGVPPEVHETADARLYVPMAAGTRSLNVAVTAAMVLGEALRQTGGFGAAEPGNVENAR